MHVANLKYEMKREECDDKETELFTFYKYYKAALTIECLYRRIKAKIYLIYLRNQAELLEDMGKQGYPSYMSEKRNIVKEKKAASKIQALWKGYKTRKSLEDIRFDQFRLKVQADYEKMLEISKQNVIKIQCFYRRHLAERTADYLQVFFIYLYYFLLFYLI